MKKQLFCKKGYIVTPDYSGIFDLDTHPIRAIIEDLWPLRSYACFEVMEAKGAVVFHLEDHLDRLVRSMERLRLPPPPRIGKLFLELKIFLKSAINESFAWNGLSNQSVTSLVRVYATGGYTHDSFHPSGPTNLFIFIQPYSVLKLKKNQGIRLARLNYLREFPTTKTVNYCVPETVMPYMTIRGFDDVLYSYGDQILEGSTFNFFTVKNNIIRTAKENVLYGITRNLVMKLAEEQNYEVQEKKVLDSNIAVADEAFITSSIRFIWPVVKIDRRTFPAGPVTLELRKKFLKYRREYYKAHRV